jgi:hypothetical protein
MRNIAKIRPPVSAAIQETFMGDNFSRFDQVTALVLAAVVVVWLFVYAVLIFIYGHDRTAEHRASGDLNVESDVHHMSLAIEQGAHFHGHSRRAKSEADLVGVMEGRSTSSAATAAE